MNIKEIAQKAKEASVLLAAADNVLKNNALLAIANALNANRIAIIQANKMDLLEAEKCNLAAPLLKRLNLDDKKLDEAIVGIQSIIALPNPIGTTLSAMELDKGLDLYKVTCPIGVVGIIFESRPDALIQISALALKSGNAVLLKGGSEAVETNRILSAIISEASVKCGLPLGWINLMETRSDVNEMLALDEYIDLIIPRGSNEFVKYIIDHSNIPVLGHADGICHVYVDSAADMDMAVRVVNDSKTQYVAVCNAAETLLVHQSVATQFMPMIKKELDKHKVTLFGCDRTCKLIEATLATNDTWKNEYLDYMMSVKIVDSIDEAVMHINLYGSCHTDAIITNDENAASHFISLVKSADVFHNCSTRFADGFRFGLGAEVGVSTNKIHARGPVGLEGMTIYKYILKGSGQIVDDYSKGKKTFTHKKTDKNY